MTAIPAELLARRSEPEARAVLEDWLTERGRKVCSVLPLIGRLEEYADAYAYADADADADAYAYADADADADAYDAYADAYADADASRAQKQLINSLKHGDEMREGLTILFSTGTYFSSCRMGWLRPVNGDEWEILSARNVRRTASNGIIALATCAAEKGLGGHELGEVDPEPEDVHRLHCLKSIRVAEKDWPKWVKEFPALKDLLVAK